MTMQLSFLEDADIEEFVQVDDLAMKDYPFAQALASGMPDGVPRTEVVTKLMRESFKQDSETAFLKVVDTESGRLVGGAFWKLQLEPLAPEQVEATAAEEAAFLQQKGKLPAEHPSFMEDQARRTRTFQVNYLKGRPHAHLTVLVVHPDFQRRGVGAMLVQWGCRRADEHGIICRLAASPEGYGLYAKNGFETVDEYDLDLRPWGVDATTVRRFMIRQPRPLES